MKKIIIGIIIIAITNKIYYHVEYGAVTEYLIRINKITKVLHVKVDKGCNGGALDVADCGSDNKYSIKLTKDEYKNIMKLWNDKRILSPILEDLGKNDKVLYKSYKDYYADDIEEYNKLDLNSDGIVTYREFGNWEINYEINRKQ